MMIFYFPIIIWILDLDLDLRSKKWKKFSNKWKNRSRKGVKTKANSEMDGWRSPRKASKIVSITLIFLETLGNSVLVGWFLPLLVISHSRSFSLCLLVLAWVAPLALQFSCLANQNHLRVAQQEQHFLSLISFISK